MNPRFGILGMGAYLPAQVLSNHDLEKTLDTSDEWIRRRTGIETRRILAPGETVLDMALHASRRALEAAGVTPDRIGNIRVGVNTWMRFPSLASQIQGALGARQAAAADVSAGCAGFLYALEDAFNWSLVEKTRYRRDPLSLVVGVDGLSHITDWKDRQTCVLFGDGAGAVVLGEVKRGGILATHMHADGRYGNLLYSDPVLDGQAEGEAGKFRHEKTIARPFLHMDGRRVYGVAVETMVADVKALLEKHNGHVPAGERITLADIDYVYPHQANLRIVEMVAERLGIPADRVYSDGVVRFGNTSTASIPIGWVENPVRRPNDRDRLEVDVAFGAGFASGAVLRQVPKA